MATRDDMAERHGRGLAELAELGLSLARHLHECALAAETPEQANAAAAAFHRVSRSVRQTMALEAKLERDRLRADREAETHAVRRSEAQVQRRRAQVRARIERLIWTEYETDEAERLADDLDDLLEEGALPDDFTATTLDVQVARLCAELSLDPPPPIGEGTYAELGAAVNPSPLAVLNPSPLAGEGGPRRGADEGSSDHLSFDAAQPPPNSS